MKIQLNEIKRMQQLAGLITESQLNENNFFGFSYKNKNKDIDTKKLMAMDEKEAFQIARKWMEKNNLDPNEIQSMKQLDQYEIEKYDEITEAEPQAESIDSVVNEALKAYRIAGTLKEEFTNPVPPLRIWSRKNSEGNETYYITNPAGGLGTDKEVGFSKPEIEALHGLIEEWFKSQQSGFNRTTSVNTKDKNLTQATVGIEKLKDFDVEISRIETTAGMSQYKGYGEEGGGICIIKVANMYQLRDDKNLQEDATSAPGTPPRVILPNTIPVPPKVGTPPTMTPFNKPPVKQTSDVAGLTKMIQSNTSLMNRLKTVNNGQEVTETIAFILNNINPKASGVNKSKLKSIIDQRFK